MQEHAVGSLGALRVDRGCREARATVVVHRSAHEQEMPRRRHRGLPPSSTADRAAGRAGRRTRAHHSTHAHTRYIAITGPIFKIPAVRTVHG